MMLAGRSCLIVIFVAPCVQGNFVVAPRIAMDGDGFNDYA
jgi:hypothetical protein